MDNSLDIDNPSGGFIRGNLFNNLYTPYKDYKPKEFVFTDEESKMLFEIDEASFAMHEINLYLDLNPDDESMITLFNDYRKKMLELIEVYESKYGPLSLTSNYMDYNPFLWEKLDFPFGGSEDVGV